MSSPPRERVRGRGSQNAPHPCRAERGRVHAAVAAVAKRDGAKAQHPPSAAAGRGVAEVEEEEADEPPHARRGRRREDRQPLPPSPPSPPHASSESNDRRCRPLHHRKPTESSGDDRHDASSLTSDSNSLYDTETDDSEDDSDDDDDSSGSWCDSGDGWTTELYGTCSSSASSSSGSTWSSSSSSNTGTFDRDTETSSLSDSGSYDDGNEEEGEEQDVESESDEVQLSAGARRSRRVVSSRRGPREGRHTQQPSARRARRRRHPTRSGNLESDEDDNDDNDDDDDEHAYDQTARTDLSRASIHSHVRSGKKHYRRRRRRVTKEGTESAAMRRGPQLFGHLPFELFLAVCAYLPVSDYRTLLGVSRGYFQAITCADVLLWRDACLQLWRGKQGFRRFVSDFHQLEAAAKREELDVMALQQRMIILEFVCEETQSEMVALSPTRTTSAQGHSTSTPKPTPPPVPAGGAAAAVGVAPRSWPHAEKIRAVNAEQHAAPLALTHTPPAENQIETGGMDDEEQEEEEGQSALSAHRCAYDQPSLHRCVRHDTHGQADALLTPQRRVRLQEEPFTASRRARHGSAFDGNSSGGRGDRPYGGNRTNDGEEEDDDENNEGIITGACGPASSSHVPRFLRHATSLLALEAAVDGAVGGGGGGGDGTEGGEARLRPVSKGARYTPRAAMDTAHNHQNGLNSSLNGRHAVNEKDEDEDDDDDDGYHEDDDATDKAQYGDGNGSETADDDDLSRSSRSSSSDYADGHAAHRGRPTRNRTSRSTHEVDKSRNRNRGASSPHGHHHRHHRHRHHRHRHRRHHEEPPEVGPDAQHDQSSHIGESDDEVEALLRILLDPSQHAFHEKQQQQHQHHHVSRRKRGRRQHRRRSKRPKPRKHTNKRKHAHQQAKSDTRVVRSRSQSQAPQRAAEAGQSQATTTTNTNKSKSKSKKKKQRRQNPHVQNRKMSKSARRRRRHKQSRLARDGEAGDNDNDNDDDDNDDDEKEDKIVVSGRSRPLQKGTSTSSGTSSSTSSSASDNNVRAGRGAMAAGRTVIYDRHGDMSHSSAEDDATALSPTATYQAIKSSLPMIGAHQMAPLPMASVAVAKGVPYTATTGAASTTAAAAAVAATTRASTVGLRPATMPATVATASLNASYVSSTGAVPVRANEEDGGGQTRAQPVSASQPADHANPLNSHPRSQQSGAVQHVPQCPLARQAQARASAGASSSQAPPQLPGQPASHSTNSAAMATAPTTGLYWWQMNPDERHRQLRRLQREQQERDERHQHQRQRHRGRRGRPCAGSQGAKGEAAACPPGALGSLCPCGEPLVGLTRHDGPPIDASRSQQQQQQQQQQQWQGSSSAVSSPISPTAGGGARLVSGVPHGSLTSMTTTSGHGGGASSPTFPHRTHPRTHAEEEELAQWDAFDDAVFRHRERVHAVVEERRLHPGPSSQVPLVTGAAAAAARRTQGRTQPNAAKMDSHTNHNDARGDDEDDMHDSSSSHSGAASGGGGRHHDDANRSTSASSRRSRSSSSSSSSSSRTRRNGKDEAACVAGSGLAQTESTSPASPTKRVRFDSDTVPSTPPVVPLTSVTIERLQRALAQDDVYPSPSSPALLCHDNAPADGAAAGAGAGAVVGVPPASAERAMLLSGVRDPTGVEVAVTPLRSHTGSGNRADTATNTLSVRAVVRSSSSMTSRPAAHGSARHRTHRHSARKASQTQLSQQQQQSHKPSHRTVDPPQRPAQSHIQKQPQQQQQRPAGGKKLTRRAPRMLNPYRELEEAMRITRAKSQLIFALQRHTHATATQVTASSGAAVVAVAPQRESTQEQGGGGSSQNAPPPPPPLSSPASLPSASAETPAAATISPSPTSAARDDAPTRRVPLLTPLRMAHEASSSLSLPSLASPATSVNTPAVYTASAIALAAAADLEIGNSGGSGGGRGGGQPSATHASPQQQQQQQQQQPSSSYPGEGAAGDEEEVEEDRLEPVSWKFAYHMSLREAHRTLVTVQDLVEGTWYACFRTTGQVHPVVFTLNRTLQVLPPIASTRSAAPAAAATSTAATSSSRLPTTVRDAGSETPASPPQQQPQQSRSMPPLTYHLLQGGAQLVVHSFPVLQIKRRAGRAATATTLKTTVVGRTPLAAAAPQPARSTTPEAMAAAAFAAEPHRTLRRLHRPVASAIDAQNRQDASSDPSRTPASAVPSAEDDADVDEDEEGTDAADGYDVDDDWGWTMRNAFVVIFSADVQAPFYVRHLHRLVGAGALS